MDETCPSKIVVPLVEWLEENIKKLSLKNKDVQAKFEFDLLLVSRKVKQRQAVEAAQRWNRHGNQSDDVVKGRQVPGDPLLLEPKTKESKAELGSKCQLKSSPVSGRQEPTSDVKLNDDVVKSCSVVQEPSMPEEGEEVSLVNCNYYGQLKISYINFICFFVFTFMIL